MPEHSIRPYLRRVVLHGVAILSGPLALVISGQRNALPIAVFYAGILLAVFIVREVATGRCRRRTTAKILRFAIALLTAGILLLASFRADNVNRYGPIISDTADAIFQTDIREAFYYVLNQVRFSGMTLYLFAFWTPFVFFSSLLIPLLDRQSNRRPGVVAALSAMLVASAVGCMTGFNEFAAVFVEAKKYRDAIVDFHASRASETIASKLETIDASKFSGNIVVVIGESVSRHHMGLYGYVRDTTPLLDRLATELIRFDDVISTHSHTMLSLADALSFNRRVKRDKTRNTLDLLSVANQAGFTTAWLSDQNAAGVWDNWVAALAQVADITRFHSTAVGKVLERSSFDDVMLTSLDEVLAVDGERRLIILHCMAAHAPCCKLIPEGFRSPDGAKFKTPFDTTFFGAYPTDSKRSHLAGMSIEDYVTTVNCYDSAIRYIDTFLAATLSRLEKENAPTFFLYFADHGEAPLLGTGHDSRSHSHFHVEMPLLAWVNSAFRDAYPDKVDALRANRSKPLSLVDLSYTLADIGQITGINGVAERSFGSPAHQTFNRTTLYARVNYDEHSKMGDCVENARANLLAVKARWGSEVTSRIWAHRVNTLGAMLEARNVFSGVEVDVVFDDTTGKFNVYHPPAENVGLTLSTLLKLDRPGLRYWLDWKNPSDDNIELALQVLERLDGRHALKNRTLVETGGPPITKLPLIAQQGWTSSYYLPTKKIDEAMARGPTDQAALADEFVRRIRNSAYNAVSFDLRGLEFVDANLMPFIRQQRLGVYGWQPKIQIDDARAVDQIKRYLNHSDLDAILVNFRSPFDL